MSEEFKKRIAIAYDKSLVATNELASAESLLAHTMSLLELKKDEVPHFVHNAMELLEKRMRVAREAHAHTNMHVQGVYWGVS